MHNSKQFLLIDKPICGSLCMYKWYCSLGRKLPRKTYFVFGFVFECLVGCRCYFEKLICMCSLCLDEISLNNIIQSIKYAYVEGMQSCQGLIKILFQSFIIFLFPFLSVSVSLSRFLSLLSLPHSLSLSFSSLTSLPHHHHHNHHHHQQHH